MMLFTNKKEKDLFVKKGEKKVRFDILRRAITKELNLLRRDKHGIIADCLVITYLFVNDDLTH